MVPLQVRSAEEDGLLQRAINYVLTGTTDPKEAPEIVDEKSCVVVMRDPRFPRYIRYYFDRFNIDGARITKKYAGARTLYELDIESDNVIIEYLGLDKTTLVQGYRSAQIPLPGDIDQTQKALRFVAGRCRPNQSKNPF
jgi:hypothetical protein